MFRFSHLEKKIILHEAKSEHLKTLLGFQGVIGLTVLSSPSPFHFFNLTQLPTAFLFIPLVASQTDTITSINREKSQNLSPGIVCLSALYNIVWLYYIQLFVFLSWGFVRPCPDILSPIGEKLSRNMFF